jgi:hypothetical protein
MSAKGVPDTSIGKSPENPLRGAVGVVLFILLIVLSSWVVFLICGRVAQSYPIQRTVFTHIYLVTLILGWFAFVVTNDSEEFFIAIVALAATAGLVMAMVITLHPVLFWISLALVVAFAIAAVLDNLNSEGRIQQLLASIYTAWLISGFVVTLGKSSYLLYSTPALKIAHIHYLLDVRYLLSGLALLIFIARALFEAFDEGMPTIPKLPEILLPVSSTQSEIDLLRPFLIVINSILFVIQKSTGAVWQVVATIATYLFRAGRNLAELVLNLILNGKIWSSIIKVIVTFTSVILVAKVTQLTFPPLVTYLATSTSPLTISHQNLINFGFFSLMFMVVLGLIVGLCRIWNVSDAPLQRAAFAGTVLMLVWSLTGVAMYALTRFDLLYLYGFRSVGAYTLLMGLIVASVFVVQVFDRLLLRTPRQSQLGYLSLAGVLLVLTIGVGVVTKMRWSKSNNSVVEEFFIWYEGQGASDDTRGRHDWKQTDPQSWVEYFPGGEQRKMMVLGRIAFEDTFGTLLRSSENSSWEYFVPDKGSPSMRLLMRVNNGKWFVLAEMMDIQ